MGSFAGVDAYLYICMYICMYVFMYVCIYVCMYVCNIYVCLYICMHVYTCMNIQFFLLCIYMYEHSIFPVLNYKLVIHLQGRFCPSLGFYPGSLSEVFCPFPVTTRL